MYTCHFNICSNYNIAILLYSNRKLTRVVAQVYIPTTIMVILSWFSFLIPPTSYPGRVGILVTLILVLINIMIMVIETSPTVSGICALIIWIIISLSMVRHVIWYLYIQLCIFKVNLDFDSFVITKYFTLGCPGDSRVCCYPFVAGAWKHNTEQTNR